MSHRMHTKIPHVDRVDACSRSLNQHCVTDNSTDILYSHISAKLKHNNLAFGDHNNQQTSGTTVGAKMAPCFAKHFMSSIEQTSIGNLQLKSVLYMLSIDDIFFILSNGDQQPIQLISIKFSTEISSTSIPLINVLVNVTASVITTSLNR